MSAVRMSFCVTTSNPAAKTANAILAHSRLFIQGVSSKRTVRIERTVGRRRKPEVTTLIKRHEFIRPAWKILKALKEPIRECKERIHELENVIAAHKDKQAKAEARFRTELAAIDRKEPQLQQYYEQLGVTEKKT